MKLEELKKQDKAYAKAIAGYLLNRMETDEPLRTKFLETQKTLVGCVEFIKTEAKKQAENNIAIIEDSQVYEWAVHYFLEDSINNESKAETKEKKEPKKEVKKEEIKEDAKDTNGQDNVPVEADSNVSDTTGDSMPVDAGSSNSEKVEEPAKEESKPIKKAEEKVKEQMTLFDFEW